MPCDCHILLEAAKIISVETTIALSMSLVEIAKSIIWLAGAVWFIGVTRIVHDMFNRKG